VVTMTIKGNVISCEECGRQMSVPMEPDSSKESIEDRARRFAADEGWGHTNREDYCPIHH
jgi:hypothetical protein